MLYVVIIYFVITSLTVHLITSFFVCVFTQTINHVAEIAFIDRAKVPDPSKTRVRSESLFT